MRQSWFWTLILGIAMFFGGWLTLFISKTSVLLPYDEAHSGLSRDQILEFNEKILHFMAHDRATLAGTMISLGVLYSFFSWFGSRRGFYWYREAILFSAFAGFLNFFAFLSYGYLDVLHAFVTCCLFQIFVIAAYAKTNKLPQFKRPAMNQSITWKAALWAQHLFVIQGTGLILAGIVITAFGATTVFVPQDIEFLGMTPLMLESLHKNLIPLIAHDRCTFGGMLISAGICILLSALWGFERGEKWLWWSYCLGGFIPYVMTLWIHDHIGYQSFIHLLPVYIGVGLLMFALALSHPYFFEGADS